MLTPEDAIKAEEEALKALEAAVAPLGQATDSSNQTPDTHYSPFRSPTSSPPPATMQTPAKNPMPHITNSLVNGATPRTISRFSPMRMLGTPRAPLGRPSGLRGSVKGGDHDEEKRTIFGRNELGRSTSSSGSRSMMPQTPALADVDAVEDDVDGEAVAGEEVTVRFAGPVSSMEHSPGVDASTSQTPGSPEDLDSPAPASSDASRTAVLKEVEGPRRIEGVEVDLETVKIAIVRPPS